MIIREETRDIFDTGFYIYDGAKGIYLGVMFPGGVLASEPINKADYIDWLRGELEKCHATKIPTVFADYK